MAIICWNTSTLVGVFIFLGACAVHCNRFWFSEFQGQVLRTLNIIKLTVQQIASSIDTSLAACRTASAPAPLVSSPFEDVDALMEFEESPTKENEDVLVRQRFGQLKF